LAPLRSRRFPYTTLFRSDPPGVQNLRVCPSRIPPAMSSSSRRVMPSGASYWPGLVTCPDREKKPNPADFSVPMEVNHSAPLATRSEEHTSELQSRFDLVC